MNELPNLSFKLIGISESSIYQVNKPFKFSLLIENNDSFKSSPRILVEIFSAYQIPILPEKRQIGPISPGRSRTITYRLRPKANGNFVITTRIMVSSNRVIFHQFSITIHVGTGQDYTEIDAMKKKSSDLISSEINLNKQDLSEDQFRIGLNCPVCGTECEGDSTFCSTCGSDLRLKEPQKKSNLTKTCSICGSTMPIKALFCGSCGSKFTE